MSTTNRPWELESFLDSLILELDRAQDTLAVKGVSRPLTYTVKDIALDLQAFPTFDGDIVRFITAQPGEEGSSRLKIELGSITDRVIREVTRGPISSDDVAIEEMDTLDDQTKKKLKKIGVTTASDVERIAARNVDLQAAAGGVDYADLANAIRKTRRRRTSPTISNVGLSRGQSVSELRVDGTNLAVGDGAHGFPAAALNGAPVGIVSADSESIVLTVPSELMRSGANRLELALDPYAIVTMEVRSELP